VKNKGVFSYGKMEYLGILITSLLKGAIGANTGTLIASDCSGVLRKSNTYHQRAKSPGVLATSLLVNKYRKSWIRLGKTPRSNDHPYILAALFYLALSPTLYMCCLLPCLSNKNNNRTINETNSVSVEDFLFFSYYL
jgi:hypothetical protein